MNSWRTTRSSAPCCASCCAAWPTGTRSNGTYTQQRYAVDAHPLGRDCLYALLDERWIDSVNYLYWDDRNPGAVTLKVSHEAFIRGWRRFRDLVDVEAQRYMSFQRLLESCRDWLAGSGPAGRMLLDVGQLRRMQMARVDEALEPLPGTQEPPPLWHKWCEWMRKSALTTPLADVAFADARRFYRSSNVRVRLRSGAAVVLIPLLVAGGLLIAYSLLLQKPVIANAERFIKAAETANAARQERSSGEVGGSAGGLKALLEAVEIYAQARTDLPFSLAGLLPRTARTVEPRLNAKLRAMLTEAFWLTPPPGKEDGLRLAAPGAVPSADGPRCDGRPGRFVTVRSTPGGARSGVFVPDELRSSSGSASLWKADLDERGRCTIDREILALPPAGYRPAIVFDPDFRHLLLVTSAPDRRQSAVAALRLDWSSRAGIPPVSDIAVVYGNEAVIGTARAQAEAPGGGAADTWLVGGGRVVKVGTQHWRVVQPGLSVLVPAPAAGRLAPLQTVDEARSEGCRPIRDHVVEELEDDHGTGGSPPVHVGTYLERGGHYYLVRLARPSGADAAAPVRTTLRVYPKPLHAETGSPRGQDRAVPLVAEIDLGEMPSEAHWLADEPQGEYAGWLVVAPPAGTAVPDRAWACRGAPPPWASWARTGCRSIALRARFAPMRRARPVRETPGLKGSIMKRRPSASRPRGSGAARRGLAAALLAALPLAQAVPVREEGPIARLDALRERLQRHDRSAAAAAEVPAAALLIDAQPAAHSAAPVEVAQWPNWSNWRNFRNF